MPVLLLLLVLVVVLLLLLLMLMWNEVWSFCYVLCVKFNTRWAADQWVLSQHETCPGFLSFLWLLSSSSLLTMCCRSEDGCTCEVSVYRFDKNRSRDLRTLARVSEPQVCSRMPKIHLIEMCAQDPKSSQNLEFWYIFAPNVQISWVIFIKFGVGEGVLGALPHSKFHHYLF